MRLEDQRVRRWYPDCPNHPGCFVRAIEVNGTQFIYCQGVGWHFVLKWWEV